MFDLIGAIDEVAVTVEVTRFLGTSVVKGRAAEPPVEKRIKIRASVQPTGEKDLKLLPEGMRNQDTIKLFTDTELFTVRRSECRTPDRLSYRGNVYQVELVDDWKDLGDYFRVIAVRVTR